MTPEKQAQAQALTNELQRVFPDPKDLIGYLIGTLVRVFDNMGFTDSQMVNAVASATRQLREHLKKQRNGLVDVVSPQEFSDLEREAKRQGRKA